MDVYLGLRFRISPSLEDELPIILSPWPVLGTLIEAGMDGSLSVAVYVNDRDEAVVADIAEVLKRAGAGEISVEEMPATDWLAGYRERAQPLKIGRRWWIDPQPAAPSPAPGDRRRLVIEASMAFGSGSHESTQLILGALEETELVGCSVLDLGTGSGILALAADDLGAHRVVGLDIDPTAIWVARQIAGQQEWEPDISWIAGPVSCLAGISFDLILCNMISARIRPLLGDLRRLLDDGGRVVFSGMLASEEDAMEDAFDAEGLAIGHRVRMGEWLSLTAVAAP